MNSLRTRTLIFSSSLTKAPWLLFIFFLTALQSISAQSGYTLDGSRLFQTEVTLEFDRALWLDSTEHCFLSLVLFQENKEEEEMIKELQFNWDKYTEVIQGIKLKFEEAFMDPLIYHHYSDSLGDYMQALFLCDDFKPRDADSLTAEITSVAGYARQSQAFFFHHQRELKMPEVDLECAALRADRAWLRKWLKSHPELHDHLVRGL